MAIRVIISKQLEQAIAERMLPISDSGGDQQYENHGEAIATDLDIALFNAFGGALLPDDEIIVQLDSDGNEYRVTIQQIIDAVGSFLVNSINGLNDDGTTVKLGGDLIENTVIDLITFDMVFDTNDGISGNGKITSRLRPSNGEVLLFTRHNANDTESEIMLLPASANFNYTSNAAANVRQFLLNETDGRISVTESASLVLLLKFQPNGQIVINPGIPDYTDDATAESDGSLDNFALYRVENDVRIKAGEPVTPDAIYQGQRRFAITPDTDMEGVVVTGTGPNADNITIQRISATEIKFVIPNEAELIAGTVHFPTAGNPGAQLHVQFEWQGNGPDGAARTSNVDMYSTHLPNGYVFNRAAEGFGGPSRLLPSTGSRYGGSALLERDWTGVPGVSGSGTPLEVRFNNYNSVNNGGNAETTFNFRFD